jgi:hypothetical protein
MLEKKQKAENVIRPTLMLTQAQRKTLYVKSQKRERKKQDESG